MHIMNLRSIKLVALVAFLCSYCCPCLTNPPTSVEKTPWYASLFIEMPQKVCVCAWEMAWEKGLVRFWRFLIKPEVLHDLKWLGGGCAVGGATGIVFHVGEKTSLFAVLSTVMMGCTIGGALGFQWGRISRVSKRIEGKAKKLVKENAEMAGLLESNKKNGEETQRRLSRSLELLEQVDGKLEKAETLLQQETQRLMQHEQVEDEKREGNHTTMIGELGNLRRAIALLRAQQNQ